MSPARLRARAAPRCVSGTLGNRGKIERRSSIFLEPVLDDVDLGYRLGFDFNTLDPQEVLTIAGYVVASNSHSAKYNSWTIFEKYMRFVSHELSAAAQGKDCTGTNSLTQKGQYSISG